MAGEAGSGDERTGPDERFPRTPALPTQSALFWVEQKDRYLRQLLIRDIEARTRRRLLVYFTNCETTAQIDGNDDQHIQEIAQGAGRGPVDLLLETNGGVTDAAEKVISVLRGHVAPDQLRVVVPRRAKSNGTLVALAASQIVMGVASELGPIDPNLLIGQALIPAQFVVQAQNADPIIVQTAVFAIAQTKKLATTLLAAGMLRDRNPGDIQAVVDQLSTRNTYHSHGSVIDVEEAQRLGLAVVRLDPDDELWRCFWLLRCMYDADSRSGRFVKVFESARVSTALRAA